MFFFFEPAGLPGLVADFNRDHGGAAFHVRTAAFLGQNRMHLVEILLPLNDNGGRPFRAEKYADVRQHLTERFGGLTAFSRSPAQGTTHMGRRKDGPRRDHRLRSDGRNSRRIVVEELPASA